MKMIPATIFMSGIEDHQSLPKFSLEKGCIFIKKPFSMDEITKKVKHCLKSHRFKRTSSFH